MLCCKLPRTGRTFGRTLLYSQMLYEDTHSVTPSINCRDSFYIGLRFFFNCLRGGKNPSPTPHTFWLSTRMSQSYRIFIGLRNGNTKTLKLGQRLLGPRACEEQPGSFWRRHLILSIFVSLKFDKVMAQNKHLSRDKW